jgi:hypothetical protein
MVPLALALGRTLIAATVALGAASFWIQKPLAQTPTPQPLHLTIPFLANATKPADLEFEGAECVVDASGHRMTCAFQQLFLTTSPVTPDTCFVTTNSYDRDFQRDSPNHWTSTEGPDGACGLLDVATLQDGGGVHWTLEIKKTVTKKEPSAACLTLDVRPETFSWQNVRRALPCTFVQPGALTP